MPASPASLDRVSKRFLLASLSALALAACPAGAPPGLPDSGGGSGAPDANGAFDAGSAVTVDAGDPVDSGQPSPDAGPGPVDAGGSIDAGEPVDAGEPDAGPPVRAYPWEAVPGPVDPSWRDTPPECDPEDWMKKYFKYRLRLRGNGTAQWPGFVSIGPDAGQSMVAGSRIPDSSCADHWWVTGASCVNPNVPNTKGIYGWGDGTIWHGWYLLHLATEHAMFRRLGLDLTETEEELRWALNAIDRVDRKAETYYGIPGGRLDGLFVRDDVPNDFIWKDAAHTILRFPRGDGFAGYGCVKGDTNCGTPRIDGGSFESLDQVVALTMGLAAVAKLVTPDATFAGIAIAQESKVITHRLINFLRDHSWKVVDPNGDSPPNEWGGSALPFSNELAKAANFITGNQFGVADYRDALSRSAGATTWAALDATWPTNTGLNHSMGLKIASITNEWPHDKLARRAMDYDDPVYALLNALLHGHTLDPVVSDFELDQVLTSAPCGGPCQNTSGCPGTQGWLAATRWGSPEDRSGGHFINGEFNGLDYTLFHNLVFLVRDGRATVKPPPDAPVCRTSNLDGLATTNGTSGSYDPWDACSTRDLSRTYCGRTFAAWLDDAYRGKARIHVGRGVLECEGDRPCVVRTGGNTGTSGTELFIGSPSADTFSGVDGDDCLYGNDGDDNLSGGQGRDELHGGAGTNRLCGETCSSLDATGESDRLFGGDGADEIHGGPGKDEVFCGGGDDWVDGGGGDDFLWGEGGNDEIDGELGTDHIQGGPGNDVLRGGLAEDRIYGGDGRDKLRGNAGDDILIGGPGNDFLDGGDDADTLWGEDGDDRLCGGCGRDFLNGGWSSADQCRDQAFPCISDPAGTQEACGSVDIARSLCNDSAYDSW